MNCSSGLLLSAATIVSATALSAATVTIEFTGEVYDVRDANLITSFATAPGVSEGDSVTGTIVYSDEAPDSLTSRNSATYRDVVSSIELTMGALSWSASTGDVRVDDGNFGLDGFFVTSDAMSGPGVGGLPVDFFQFAIWEPVDIWDSVALTDAEALQDLVDNASLAGDINFLRSELPLGSRSVLDAGLYRFSLETVTVTEVDDGPAPVPLPASAALLGGALLGAGALSRKRRDLA